LALKIISPNVEYCKILKIRSVAVTKFQKRREITPISSNKKIASTM
jgi:hypothetical protein